MTYTRLHGYLKALQTDSVSLSFVDLESVLGAPLPDSARKHRAWWSNGGHGHASAWLDAGFRVSSVELVNSVVSFARVAGSGTSPIPSGKPPFGGARKPGSLRRQQVERLSAHFEQALDVFERRRIFTGPSEYFYIKTVNVRRQTRSLRKLADSEAFAESVYATLTAWGMHRMGEKVATKLAEFNEFRETLSSLLRDASSLESLSLLDFDERGQRHVTELICTLLRRAGLGKSRSTLVLNAKTLHFALPDLVPPIDRTYTLKFFLGRMQPPGSPAE